MKSSKAYGILSSNLFFFLCLAICFNPFKAWTQSQGPLDPGTRVNNILGGSVAWSAPNNAAGSDNSYATATNGTSNFLNVSNFGFSIPSSSSITGILVEVERKGAPVSPVGSGTWTTFTPPAYSSGTVTATYGSTSYSYNLPVSSATNNRRLLVVTVGIENVDNIGTTDPSLIFGTATYNGVAMTLAGFNSRASSTTSNYVAVYYLAESGLPSSTGSRALVITKTINGELSSGVISPGEYVEIVGVNTFTNVDQTTPATVVSQNTASPSTSITSPAINFVRNGDYLVAATTNNTPAASGSITQESGYTENFELSHNNTAGPSTGGMLEVQSKSLAGVTGTPTVTVSATAGGSTRLAMVALSVNAARVYDQSIRLIGSLGLQVGNNLAVTPSNSLPNAWPDADAYLSYGSSSNLWGTTWTPAQVNSSNFGVSFQVDADFSIASVDHIRVTVFHSVPLNVSFQSFTLTSVKEEVIASISFKTDNSNTHLLTLEKAGSDLVFKSVESVTVTGGSVLSSLTISDPHPSAGANYYRIKTAEEGQGASVNYSAVQQIIFENEQGIDLLIYPNPVVEYLVVESLQKITAVELLDATGNIFYVDLISFGGNKFKIEEFPVKGLCTLLFHTEAGTTRRKVIIDTLF